MRRTVLAVALNTRNLALRRRAPARHAARGRLAAREAQR
jgi:hypothetical protein